MVIFGVKRGERMYTRELLMKEIEDVETRMFYLDMKDRWSQADFELMRLYQIKLKELKQRLEQLECNISQ